MSDYPNGINNPLNWDFLPDEEAERRAQDLIKESAPTPPLDRHQNIGGDEYLENERRYPVSDMWEREAERHQGEEMELKEITKEA